MTYYEVVTSIMAEQAWFSSLGKTATHVFMDETISKTVFDELKRIMPEFLTPKSIDGLEMCGMKVGQCRNGIILGIAIPGTEEDEIPNAGACCVSCLQAIDKWDDLAKEDA